VRGSLRDREEGSGARDTVEVIVGGVLGPNRSPEVVLAGRYRGDHLVQVG